jgi:lysophospholipase L1-like esterase
MKTAESNDESAAGDAQPAPRPPRSRWTRLRWLLLAGCLLIGLAGGYVYFHLYLPVGSGPAGPAVDSAPFEQPWTERKVLLVGIGDSVTAGFGASQGKAYVERLAANPPDEFADMQGRSLGNVLANLSTLNIAVSGSNSLEHLRHVRERLPKQEADVFGLVVMTTGGNDLIHWYGRSPPREGAMYGATLEQALPWIAGYEQRLDTIFTEIESRFPGGCAIFVADIYDPSDGRGDPESTWALPLWPDCVNILTAYNAALRAAASKHPGVHVVPVHDAFLGHGIHCRKVWLPHYDWNDPSFWFSKDILEDPNDRGYDALRRVFLNAIAEHREAIACATSRLD